VTTAADLIKTAQEEVGIHEDPPFSNKQKFGEWFGMNGSFWCAEFVSWCFSEAGMEEVRYASCDVGAGQFRSGAWGEWMEGPTHPVQAGDVVFYQFGKPGDADHTGIVVHDNGSTISTIEGNTSPQGSTGSDRNGGGVFPRVRAKNSLVMGFGRPKYSGKGHIPGPQMREVEDFIEFGDRGPGVRKVQELLLRHGADPNRLEVDGDFGPITRDIVKHFQAAHHLEVDGQVGPNTWKALRAKTTGDA
jgi:hypothetical protein